MLNPLSKEQINIILKNKPKGLEVVGSVKRNKNVINDIDFITSKDLTLVLNEFKNKFNNIKVISKGNKILKIEIDNVPVDIFKYNKGEKMYMKFGRSQEKGKLIYYKKQAKNKNLLLNNKGLFNKNGERIPIKNITELKKYLKS